MTRKSEFVVYSSKGGNMITHLTSNELYKVKPDLKAKPVINPDRLEKIKAELQFLEKGVLVEIPMKNAGVVLEVHIKWISDNSPDWKVSAVKIVDQAVASKLLLKSINTSYDFFNEVHNRITNSKELSSFQKRIRKFEKSLTPEESEVLF